VQIAEIRTRHDTDKTIYVDFRILSLKDIDAIITELIADAE
jgi:hypothetical protein